MGRALSLLQMKAQEIAQGRIDAENSDDVCTLRSRTGLSRSIPVKNCSIKIVHRNQWQRFRIDLTKGAHAEYMRLGGKLNRSQYAKKILQDDIKKSLLLLAIYQTFGPIILFWNTLSLSHLYKLKFAEVRAAPVPPSNWSKLNKCLQVLTTMDPLSQLDHRKKVIEDIFSSAASDDDQTVEKSNHFDYLEDEDTYKEIRDKALEEWVTQNANVTILLDC